jgi:hypothetical protein
VVDRRRVARVGGVEHQVSRPQPGRLREGGVLVGGDAGQRDAGLRVGVAGQPGAVEADDADVRAEALAGAGEGSAAPGVHLPDVAQRGADRGPCGGGGPGSGAGLLLGRGHPGEDVGAVGVGGGEQRAALEHLLRPVGGERGLEAGRGAAVHVRGPGEGGHRALRLRLGCPRLLRSGLGLPGCRLGADVLGLLVLVLAEGDVGGGLGGTDLGLGRRELRGDLADLLRRGVPRLPRGGDLTVGGVARLGRRRAGQGDQAEHDSGQDPTQLARSPARRTDMPHVPTSPHPSHRTAARPSDRPDRVRA